MGRWVYGLDHIGDRGKVKGLKDNLPFTYDRESEPGRREGGTWGFFWGGGGVKTNTEGVQTTKKWEADVHAKR